MSDNELVNRCNKMALWLGYSYSAFQSLLHNDKVAECQKEPIRKAFHALENALDGLFYKDNENE